MAIPKFFSGMVGLMANSDWPHDKEWDELAKLQAEARKYGLNYAAPYVLVERHMDMNTGDERFSFAICRYMPTGKQFRETLGVYTSVGDTVAMMRLLIGVAKDKRAEEAALVDGAMKQIYNQGANKC